jgi:hypothetical protein
MKSGYVPYTEEVKKKLDELYGLEFVRPSALEYMHRTGKTASWMLEPHPLEIYGKPITYWFIVGGFRMAEVADALNITYHCVSRWIHQESEPRGESLKNLKAFILNAFPEAVSLDCDLSEIQNHIRENYPCVSERALDRLIGTIRADMEKTKEKLA